MLKKIYFDYSKIPWCQWFRRHWKILYSISTLRNEKNFFVYFKLGIHFWVIFYLHIFCDPYVLRIYHILKHSFLYTFVINLRFLGNQLCYMQLPFDVYFLGIVKVMNCWFIYSKLYRTCNSTKDLKQVWLLIKFVEYVIFLKDTDRHKVLKPWDIYNFF